LELFNGKAHCSSCHTSDGTAAEPPAFSNFGYDNIGVPKNPDNPFYAMDQVTVDGAAINPAGVDWVDSGLGGFLRTLVSSDDWRTAPYVPASMSSLSAAELSQLAEENMGKHRVPTLRNVGRRPTPEFVKAYTHNGYFKSLETLVHFYNTRDVLPRCTSDFSEQQAVAAGCWPAPEVAEGIDAARSGNLGLIVAEEDALVAFMVTLSDRGGAMMHGGAMHGPNR
ncbi:MAG TPA: hypothetical protein VJR89_12220, partial [Polyangiales bacterium]|nr:hypothetical protein [Polyangiales bacterium]